MMESFSFIRKGAYLTIIRRSFMVSVSTSENNVFLNFSNDNNLKTWCLIVDSSLGSNGINFKIVNRDSLLTSEFESFKQRRSF